jgi:carbamoyl-phosphate synthase large subunit
VRSPNVLQHLQERAVDLVINIPKNSAEDELANDYLIRRKAADFGIPLITNIQLAQRFVEAISKKSLAELRIKSWQEYFLQWTPATVEAQGQEQELRPAA